MCYLLRGYNKLSLPFKASLWYIICSILQKGISLITTPIFTRLLSTQEYGRFSLFNSWQSIITIFATLYLTAGVFNNGMYKYKKDRDGFTSSLLSLTSFLTVILFAVYLAFADFWNMMLGLTTPIMIMMFVDIFFTSAMSFWAIRNRYEYKYLSIVIFTFLTTLLVPILSIILVLSTDTYRVEARILGTVIVHVIIYSILFVLNIKRGKKIINIEYWRYATSFNIPLIPHYLSQTVLNQSDRIMIEKYCNTSEVGIYSVAYNCALMMNIIIQGIEGAFTPWMYENMTGNENTKIGYVALKIELLVGFGCCIFSLAAPEMVYLLATKEYYNAIWIIPPVAISVLFILIYSYFAKLEFYFEKKRLILIASVIAAMSNIILNSIFIPMFGYIAAGYTTLASYVAYSLIHYYFMCKICRNEGIQNPFNGRKIYFLAGICTIVSIGSSVLYYYTIARYLVIAAITLLFVIYLRHNKDDLLSMIKN